ncbi:integrase [Oceanisphaera litoralis]|uniref:tyrosine-type recombinase/integrase n=1 Tax=Oceanisphaera litoralis TaxID=225144 RepID=UPI00195C6B96|nr:tyrosine-type recombinase/integrase [Oceanisphaera litoralis]MBM7455224.1 integrase [Oceanisphaera litoralis]
MKLTTKVARLLDATPGVHIHKGRLRIALKVPGRTTPVRKSLGLPPTEANILYAGNKLSAMKIDVQTGNFTADEAAFWHKHLPDDPRYNIVNRTLRDYFNQYRESRKFDLSHSSQRGLETVVALLESHRLLDRDVRDISHRDLEQVRSHALTTRKATTVRLYFTRLRAVIDEAIRDGHLEQSPFVRLRKLRQSSAESDPVAVEPFTQDELTRLQDSCKTEPARQMVGLLFWTGIRPGELKALAWEDVDLEAGTMRIRYSLSRGGHIKPPKTAAGVRTVDLLPPAVAILKRQRELTFMLPARKDEIRLLHNKTRTEPRRRVFLSSNNKPYRDPTLLTTHQAWADLLRRAGLTYREAYQLRHSYASMMLMVGAHPAYLARQMGHADWGMIRKVYAKWVADENPGYRDELARKLGILDPHMTPGETTKSQGVDK